MTAGRASPYGSTYRRAAAAAIDGAVISVLQFGLVYGVPAAAQALGQAAWEIPAGLTVLQQVGLALLIAAVIGVAYRTAYDASPWQATPGRRALSLKVCTVDGERLSPGAAFVRALAREVGMPLFALGALPFLWTRRRQAAHDLLAGSVVVLERVAPSVAASAAPERGLPRGGWVLILHVATAVPITIGLWLALPSIERFFAAQEVVMARVEAGNLQDEVTERYDEGEALDDIHSEPAGETLDKSTADSGEPPLPAWLDTETHTAAINGGAVVITFLPTAAEPLRGKHLVLMPAIAEDGTLDWACGRASAPDGHVPHRADYASLTDIEDEYLPPDCRPADAL